MSKLKITLKRGLAGEKKAHRKVAWALGLRKTNQTVVRNDSPQIQGMVYAVRHLLKVEKA
ncbi:MAG: 50S ribosomal protein L30 [candidate division Zixibacteria bacterium]|nr:50S ribosomal protein L30 [candidate division Zixibacteria bacterium]MCI0596934.1 50S ribosomal protein L30 [candidate division Zixibacteria bacterium]